MEQGEMLWYECVRGTPCCSTRSYLLAKNIDVSLVLSFKQACGMVRVADNCKGLHDFSFSAERQLSRVVCVGLIFPFYRISCWVSCCSVTVLEFRSRRSYTLLISVSIYFGTVHVQGRRGGGGQGRLWANGGRSAGSIGDVAPINVVMIITRQDVWTIFLNVEMFLPLAAA